MIAFTWIAFALLTLFWTGSAWIAAAATDWLAQALASGDAAQAARDLAALPLPPWLAFWVDPEWVQALQGGVLWLLDGAGAGLPLAGAAASWLVPAIWIGWALGVALLLAAAIAVHLLLRRWQRHRARQELGLA